MALLDDILRLTSAPQQDTSGLDAALAALFGKPRLSPAAAPGAAMPGPGGFDAGAPGVAPPPQLAPPQAVTPPPQVNPPEAEAALTKLLGAPAISPTPGSGANAPDPSQDFATGPIGNPGGGGLLSGLSNWAYGEDPKSGLSGLDRLALLGGSMRSDDGGRQEQSVWTGIENRQKLTQLRAQQLLDRQAMGMFTGGAPSGGTAPGAGASPVDAVLSPQATGSAGVMQALGAGPAGGVHVSQVTAGPDGNATSPGPPMVGLSDTQRKGLAALAIAHGHPDQAASIMKGDVSSDANGYMIDHSTGAVLGRLPLHQYVNNLRVDPNAPDAPAFIPKVPDGMVPDPNKPGGYMNAPGVAAGMGAQTAATADATEGTKAGYDLVSVPDGNGGTKMMTRAAAAATLGGSGSSPAAVARRVLAGGAQTAPSASGGQLGSSPPPDVMAGRTTLANKRAETQAQREGGAPKAVGAMTDLDNTTDTAIATIKRIIPQVNGLTTGVAANFANLKGFGPHNLAADLETLKGITSMGNLQSLRDNSPTGAGLGRVTQSEISLLSSIGGSLDQGQSPDQLKARLGQVLDNLQKSKANRHSVYAQTYGGGDGTAPAPARASGSERGYGGFTQAQWAAAAKARKAQIGGQ